MDNTLDILAPRIHDLEPSAIQFLGELSFNRGVDSWGRCLEIARKIQTKKFTLSSRLLKTMRGLRLLKVMRLFRVHAFWFERYDWTLERMLIQILWTRISVFRVHFKKYSCLKSTAEKRGRGRVQLMTVCNGAVLIFYHAFKKSCTSVGYPGNLGVLGRFKRLWMLAIQC